MFCTFQLFSEMYRLIDWLIDWLIGWLVGWLVGWLKKQKLTISFLVTVVAQFTAKTVNSEKAIYPLSLVSCSINKLLFTSLKCYSILRGKSFFAPGNGGVHPHLPIHPYPFLYGHVSGSSINLSLSVFL